VISVAEKRLLAKPLRIEVCKMELTLPTWNMGYLTYPNVQEYLKHKDIVMIPVASFEQHS
jgi:hypothetical protein